jgi:glycosyltransferase involved in cell wall biosynthesis
LNPPKNFIVPLKAVKGLGIGDISYKIIGGGIEEQELREAAGNDSRIVLSGTKPRKYCMESLSNADIFIMSSLWEGRSIAQMEAAAFDLPMILSDVPALREPFGEKPLGENELFRVCKFGYLVKTENVSAYQKAIMHFFENKEDVVEGMKKTVREVSLQNDIEMVAERYIDCFKTEAGL